MLTKYFVQKSKLKKFIDSSVNINQLGTDRAINVLAVSKFYLKNKILLLLI